MKALYAFLEAIFAVLGVFIILSVILMQCSPPESRRSYQDNHEESQISQT